MPKNKKGRPTLEELLDRPWCYYCERDFDDLKILIDHQRHKHFKCERCGRRLNTAGGLSVHMNHVHKEQLGPIENALPNRSNHEIEIFGMEGIPDEVVSAHRQRVITQYGQAEAEHRAATGNPAPGSSGPPAKKPKFESPSEMKRRLAEHRAKKAAEEAAEATPPEAPPVAPVAPETQAPYSYPHVGYGAPPYPAPPQQYAYYASPDVSQSHAPAYMSPGRFPMQPLPASLPAPMPPVPQAQPVPMPPVQPVAVGLPQRPTFNAPAVDAAQMQQLHGHAAAEPTNGTKSAGEEKKAAPKRMVYGDNEVSPEEKMAQMPRYAFSRVAA